MVIQYWHSDYIFAQLQNNSCPKMNNTSSHSSRKKINNYMICLDKPIGEGSYGKVYLCYCINNPEQALASKIINKKNIQHDDYMKQALKRQFNIHSKLKHPNIVTLIDMQETTNNIYIFQEYCEGTTLKQVLHQRKRLQQKEVMYCMKKICMGYSELVQKGIIHRDLKPQNIMISGEELKIGDFGFAKQIATQKQFLTSVVGSPIYMAPQILRGEKYNSKCDVWSFGIIIFELLYGHFPWHKKLHGPQNANSLLKILTQPLKFPDEPKISENLKQFIEQCLQTDEKQRLSWLQIFEHKIFSQFPQFMKIGKQYRNNALSAINLLNQLASSVKPYQLIGAFLSFKVKALDFKLFSSIIKNYLIPEANQCELTVMYEMFDKDCNGVVDIEQFVKSFQVCDQTILKLINQLIEEQNMFYDQLQDQYLFKNTARSLKKYSKQTIDDAYAIICQIQYDK